MGESGERFAYLLIILNGQVYGGVVTEFGYLGRVALIVRMV